MDKQAESEKEKKNHYNLKRKRFIGRNIMNAFAGYVIVLAMTIIAKAAGLADYSLVRLLYIALGVAGSTVFFFMVLYVKKNITFRFSNIFTVFQLANWMLLYAFWVILLSDIRLSLLFLSFIALIFFMANVTMFQSIIMSFIVFTIHLSATYYTIFFLGAPGNFAQELFYSCCFLLAAFFISYMSSVFNKQRLELNNAKNNVIQLSGLLPICANCKKVRDDGGYWQQVEKFVTERTDATFSHSLCPECVKALYPEIHSGEPAGTGRPFSALTQGIRPQEVDGARPGEKRPADIAALAPVLTEMARLLSENNLAARECVASLRRYGGTMLRKEIRELEECMDNLEFEKALSILREIGRNINVPPERTAG